MKTKKRGNQFLSGFGNNNIIDEFYVSDNKKLTPGTILSESDDAYKIELGIPYFRKQDVNLEYADNQLIVSGHRPMSTPTDKKTRSYKGVFEIPEDVISDKIEVHFNDGLLRVVLPKKHIKAKFQKSTVQ
jgi:HSP20 family protein